MKAFQEYLTESMPIFWHKLPNYKKYAFKDREELVSILEKNGFDIINEKGDNERGTLTVADGRSSSGDSYDLEYKLNDDSNVIVTEIKFNQGDLP